MIFQAPINLKVDDRIVQVIIDLDTGLIGFSELIDNATVEYYYGESPVEFKKALLERLEPSFTQKSLGNFKICRKNENVKLINKYLREENKENR
jgi:1,4-dihydroxy-2-naphthoyl-CoA synthase